MFMKQRESAPHLVSFSPFHPRLSHAGSLSFGGSFSFDEVKMCLLSAERPNPAPVAPKV